MRNNVIYDKSDDIIEKITSTQIFWHEFMTMYKMCDAKLVLLSEC